MCVLHVRSCECFVSQKENGYQAPRLIFFKKWPSEKLEGETPAPHTLESYI